MPTLTVAEQLMRFLSETLQDLPLGSDLRTRVSTACYGVALDHHHAITILVANQRLASSFALTRSVFESFIRGAWLQHCATDTEVIAFSKGANPPGISRIIQDIECNPAYAGQVLSAIKNSSWEAMCGYTHTGSHQAQRWQTEHSIEPSYTPTEVAEVLTFINLFAALSAVELAAISGDSERFDKIASNLASFLPTEA